MIILDIDQPEPKCIEYQLDERDCLTTDEYPELRMVALHFSYDFEMFLTIEFTPAHLLALEELVEKLKEIK